MPCDTNRISYGCEKMGNSLGFCWSECAGYLPKAAGTGVFMYEGWCFNVNNGYATAQEVSGKQARYRRGRPSPAKAAEMNVRAAASAAAKEALEEDIAEAEALAEYEAESNEVRAF